MPLDGLFIVHRARALEREGASDPCPICNRVRKEGNFDLQQSVEDKREPSPDSSAEKKAGPSPADGVGKYHPSKWRPT